MAILHNFYFLLNIFSICGRYLFIRTILQLPYLYILNGLDLVHKYEETGSVCNVIVENLTEAAEVDIEHQYHKSPGKQIFQSALCIKLYD